MQEFTVGGPDVIRFATVDLPTPEGETVPSLAMTGSGNGTVRAPLVDAGTGAPGDFPPEAAGAIALVQRQDVPFSQMAANAIDAGAQAILVANREPTLFRGEIDPPVDLIAAGVSSTDGDRLRALLAQGPVELTIDVRDGYTAQNVVARPPDGVCRTVTGGHIDTVPWAPGANDNASGSAVVIELARAAAAARLSGHCFALFGSEEVGLVGSAFFVDQLSETERAALELMINLDVAASDDPPLVLGSAQLVERAESIADMIGVEAERGVLPRDIGSDHISFLNAQVPSLMITTPGFSLIHTAEDTVANLEPVFVQAVAEIAFALLQEPPLAP